MARSRALTESRPAGTVLILTNPEDRTAGRVAAELAVRGVPVRQLDPAAFPRQVALDARIAAGRRWSGAIVDRASGHRLVNLGEVRSVYWRRPTQFQVDEGMSGPERAFAYGEARRGFGGVLQALPDCLWVNDPVAAARAEYKPVQLAAAAAVGLRIPQTIITSDPDRAYTWARELGRPVIYKPLSGIWHADEEQLRVLYTTPVEDLAQLRDPAFGRTAQLLQEQVRKRCEARAVVVGEHVGAVEIDAASDAARVDWRSDYDALTYRPLDLPEDVTRGLVALHRRLGLRYGAADLALTPEGDVVFFETNPRGEWGWLEAEAGLPVAELLADLLQRGQP